MGVLHSFSIKNIFYHKMGLRLFYFHLTKWSPTFKVFRSIVLKIIPKRKPISFHEMLILSKISFQTWKENMTQWRAFQQTCPTKLIKCPATLSGIAICGFSKHFSTTFKPPLSQNSATFSNSSSDEWAWSYEKKSKIKIIKRDTIKFSHH